MPALLDQLPALHLKIGSIASIESKEPTIGEVSQLTKWLTNASAIIKMEEKEDKCQFIMVPKHTTFQLFPHP